MTESFIQKDLTNKIKEINPRTSSMQQKSTPDSTVQELEETTLQVSTS